MHQPLRTCVGCRAVRPQAELLRSRCLNGKVLPDRSVGTGAERHGREDSPKTGRSAYLCPARACFEQAARRGGFARAGITVRIRDKIDHGATPGQRPAAARVGEEVTVGVAHKDPDISVGSMRIRSDPPINSRAV